MADILHTIADHARERVAAAQAERPLADLKAQCRELGPTSGGRRFVEAIQARQKAGEAAFICEVKKASPSKGVIAEDFPYLDIALAYEAAGADCISCLTEPKWFLGSDDIFRQIRAEVATPMLRKDFVVDEYQLYEARLMGADAVLLICALLDDRQLAHFAATARLLGLAALVECHDEEEIARAAKVGAALIGVNNRNLKDFSVDLDNATRLRGAVPRGVLFVAESGVMGPEDAMSLRAGGADALLVGEYLMRSDDKATTLAGLREAAAAGNPEVVA